MRLIPLHSPVLRSGDDLAAVLKTHGAMPRDGDILVVSSKAVAITEGAAIDLSTLQPSQEAEELAAASGDTPAYREAMLEELRRLHGTIVGVCPEAVLTELKPDGLAEGSILAATAGLDHSNIEEGYAIGWPHDPVRSAETIRRRLREETGADVAVIISDSCCRPRRLGVTAFALVTCGIDPLESRVGHTDLFGKEIKFTHEARADQLATAANFLMGNTDEAVPAVLIRDHGLPLSDFSGWVPGIDRDRDLFSCMLRSL